MPDLSQLTNQQILYIAMVVAVVMVACYYLIKPASHRRKKVFGDDLAIWPYQPLPLQTDTEVVFFRLLEQAVPELYIFSQVQLSRVIEAQETGESAANNAIWRRRIAQMSVDYLLVDTDAQTPLLVIELDDWSHDLADRRLADAKKDKALSCAGIPVMRYHGEDMPSLKALRYDIIQTLEQYY